MNSPDAPTPQPSQNKAAEHVEDAHKLLTALQQQLEHHPELDEAIRKLELALSALTLQTGGLL
jgi:Lon protease-like protein